MKRTKDDNEWAALHPACWICGKDYNWRGIHTHEICRRGQSTRALHRCNYFRACADCHDEILVNKATAPHVVQLAVKLQRDPEHFDLRKWLEVTGRHENYVTMYDVENCVKAMKLEAIWHTR